MFYYSTNIMGPTTSWYTQNNIDRSKHHYVGGRIDIECDPDDVEYTKYGYEDILPIMTIASYSNFSDWLDCIATPTMLSTESLIAMYEEHNPPLELYKEPQ